MVAALYRRYRPQTFGEIIGQAQVTEPLAKALDSDRVSHAYLFSGPRGCGKTTSARILARCLNCHRGPAAVPCGSCPSCEELSRDGGGSLDVVEIDAASHNGVDDARELRERAVFSPARDRYKIFILDEAHMVTQQGFNALLKLVEEPPEHVKFIFATTEPEKVIGTIRSRTHHYPFRLVPPADLLNYVESVAKKESVAVEEGVISLVVRAGGGSVRDTLSVFDQLMSGSEDGTLTYDRATGLLGYTHGELLAEIVDSISKKSGEASFVALEKVMQTGQDPRRFGEDLLDYLRDLIVVIAAGSETEALLPGVSSPVIEQMRALASALGPRRLLGMADVVSEAITTMVGATSPKLHLELLLARLLVGGRESAGSQPAKDTEIGSVSSRSPSLSDENSSPPVLEPKENSPEGEPVSAGEDLSGQSEPLTTELLIDSWPKVVNFVGDHKKAVWSVLVDSTVLGLDGDVVTIGFPVLESAEVLRKPQGPGLPVNAELLRAAIESVTGHRVRFIVKETPPEDQGSGQSKKEWPTKEPPVSIGSSEDNGSDSASQSEDSQKNPEAISQGQTGEAAVRELLGGELIEEQIVPSRED